MKTKEFVGFLRGWLGELGTEEGLRHGNPEQNVAGITVCWMATTKVIKCAISSKHNVIVAHEDLLFPPDYSSNFSSENLGIVSKRRISLLEKYDISLIRVHGLLDRFCILDDFGNKLKLGKPLVKENFYRVYEIRPLSLKKFANTVKRNLKISQVRITGHLTQRVNKIGGLWGGLGLSINACFIDKILNYHVDTVIAGEMDEYTMRACSDLNVGIVEVGHEVSEDIGLKRFTRILRQELPEIPAKFVSNPYPWRVS